MKIYDTIYIGTGPISVIDAAYSKAEGNQILLIDEKARVGGAWVAIPVGEYGELEIGCHIWSYNKYAYDFMSDRLKLNLQALKPQPYFIKGKTRLIYDHKNAIGTVKRTIGFLGRFDFKGLSKYYKTNPAARLGLIPKQYLYPVGGARDVQRKLEELVKEKELKLSLETTVNTITKKVDYWELATPLGNILRTKKLVLTATSSVQKISYGQKLIKLRHRSLNYTHFHLVLEGELLKELSYIRVLDDPIVHRISDVTYQLENKLADNIHVILVGVFDSKLPKDLTEEEVVQVLMDYLIQKKIIGTKMVVKYAQKNKFETTYISDEQKEEINKLEDTISVMSTTDLMYGIHYKQADWR